MIVPGDPVGKLQSVILRWEYRTNPLNPLTWRFFLTPHIYIGWMQIESIEEKHRYILFGEVTGLVTPDLYSYITRLTRY